MYNNFELYEKPKKSILSTIVGWRTPDRDPAHELKKEEFRKTNSKDLKYFREEPFEGRAISRHLRQRADKNIFTI